MKGRGQEDKRIVSGRGSHSHHSLGLETEKGRSCERFFGVHVRATRSHSLRSFWSLSAVFINQSNLKLEDTQSGAASSHSHARGHIPVWLSPQKCSKKRSMKQNCPSSLLERSTQSIAPCDLHPRSTETKDG